MGINPSITCKQTGEIFSYYRGDTLIATSSNEGEIKYNKEIGSYEASNLTDLVLYGTNEDDNYLLGDCTFKSGKKGLQVTGENSARGGIDHITTYSTADYNQDDSFVYNYNSDDNTYKETTTHFDMLGNAENTIERSFDSDGKLTGLNADSSSPKESKIKVEKWQSNQSDRNNCWWNIAKNNYGGILNNGQIYDACQKIAEYNNMDVKDVLNPNKELELPDFEVKDGKWTGKIATSPSVSQEAYEADSAFAKEGFADYDADKNGTISREEYINAEMGAAKQDPNLGDIKDDELKDCYGLAFDYLNANNTDEVLDETEQATLGVVFDSVDGQIDGNVDMSLQPSAYQMLLEGDVDMRNNYLRIYNSILKSQEQ